MTILGPTDCPACGHELHPRACVAVIELTAFGSGDEEILSEYCGCDHGIESMQHCDRCDRSFIGAAAYYNHPCSEDQP